MSKELIYVVEDENHIRELIVFNLEENGYKVKGFANGEDALAECALKKPDLFMLDIMLPGIDGIEICKRVKQNPEYKKIHIIMVSVKGEEFDRILGLELGADDYITKPFSVRELMTRVKVLFRRKEEAIEDIPESVKVGGILVDIEQHRVSKNGKPIDMTLKEFELLKTLILNKGKVMSREILLEKIWGFDFLGETRTVDVHIRYLRQKIENDDKKPEYIETVRGIGYRFVSN